MDRLTLLQMAQKHYAEAIAIELYRLTCDRAECEAPTVLEYIHMLNAIEDIIRSIKNDNVSV